MGLLLVHLVGKGSVRIAWDEGGREGGREERMSKYTKLPHKHQHARGCHGDVNSLYA